MSNEFMPADVGRDITAGGGVGTITGYTDGENVTVNVLYPFPATTAETGDWTILGSPMTACTPSATGPVGSTITLTLAAAGWRTSDVGRYVKINGGLCMISGYTSTTVVNAIVESALAAAVAAPAMAWSLEGSVWGGKNGYPRCGTLHEQRLFAAGSPGFPQTIWGSVIGEYFDFTLGVLDDEALAFVVANGEINPIMHLASVRGLLALTSGGEFSIAGSGDKPITPTNVQVRDQSAHGCSEVEPERIANELYFIQRAGRKVRALSENQYSSDQYVAPDMAALAEHITTTTITSMAYASEPESLLFTTRADGQMPVLTAERDQETMAWTRQTTQGAIERVATVPVADGYRVFAVVRRVIGGVSTRYIEMADPALNTDSALTGTSEAGSSIWSGFDHLEGMKVRVKGDGILLQDRVVEGGQIEIERTAKTIEVGLDYVSTIKTLPPEISVPVGSLQAGKLQTYRVTVRLLETIGCTANLQEISFRNFGADVLDQPPQPYSGDKEVGSLGWGNGSEAYTLIQQTLPYDFHVLAVITHHNANEK